MGKKSKTGGVAVAGRERIQFDFKFGGVRYRPTLLRTPTETNLFSLKVCRHHGPFFFTLEYRHGHKVTDPPRQ
jgi:hypothetical protein